MEKIVISIDAMGGDNGPSVTVPAAFKILAKYSDVKLILVGNSDVLNSKISKLASRHEKFLDRLIIKHASEEVLMDESPSKALRNKKDSSMRVAIDLVKEGVACACVSAGNTGALMATARFVIKTLPGIDRPAIIVSFPTVITNKHTYVLDLGANVDSSANYLSQFAIMGSVLSSSVDNVNRPKVALLNIGSEDNKGNEQIKEAAKKLVDNKHINYVGFVEGDDIFSGNVDVIVCDGFTGNVMLKSIEGVMRLVACFAKRAMTSSFFSKILAVLALPMLKGMYRKIDPAKYNGATFIGLQGIVIKSHGSADTDAFTCALEKAIIEADRQVPQKIKDELAVVLEDSI